MYKYLPISTQLQEMMVMLKSLPTNTVVVDKKGRVIDINQTALNFFKVKSIDDFSLKKWGALNNPLPIIKIVQQLKKGVLIQNKNFVLKAPDSTSINVIFSATMLNGAKEVFIFQFFEVFQFTEYDEDYLNDTAFRAIRNLRIMNRYKSSINSLLIEGSTDKPEYHHSVDENMIQLISEKYPRLTPNQVMICALMASSMSIKDIAKATNKFVGTIDGAVRRIAAKLDLQSPLELYQELLN